MAAGCEVPGCDRPHRTHGYCRLHFERVRDGRPLDMLLQVNKRRHERRSHREALADLASRLVRLEVCQTPEEAVALVVVLLSHWPSVDPGLLGLPEPTPAADLVELPGFPPPGSAWPS